MTAFVLLLITIGLIQSVLAFRMGCGRAFMGNHPRVVCNRIGHNIVQCGSVVMAHQKEEPSGSAAQSVPIWTTPVSEATEAPYKVKVKPLVDRLFRAALDTYLMRGEVLRDSPEMLIISADIQQVVQAAPRERLPKLFYFINASSGRGKSQMAQSLGLPVVYLPLTPSQDIYKCFSTLSVELSLALKEDFRLLAGQTHGNVLEKVTSFVLYDTQTEFRTVGLLVELFKLVWGKSNEESIKLLSGRDSDLTFSYAKMSLADAREAVAAQLERAKNNSSAGEANNSAAQQQTNGFSIPMFMIDQVPPLNRDNTKAYEEYQRCILLRNLIRCMDCVCLLSGTEAATMNTFDYLPLRARCELSREYMRLITRLPPTSLEVLKSEDRYARVIAALNQDVRAMLQRTRPWFAELVLKAMLQVDASSDGAVQVQQLQHQQQHANASSAADASKVFTDSTLGQLTNEVLSLTKEKILSQNYRFSTIQGLYAQTMLVHPQLFSHPVNEFSKEEEYSFDEAKLADEKREQLMAEMQSCVRHHYADLRPANSGINLHRPLPLFVCPDQKYMSVEIGNEQKDKCFGDSTTLTRFLSKVVFAKPCDDELLYLILLRDGLLYKQKEQKQRVSSSFALRTLFYPKESGDGESVNFTLAPACNGRFLETEVNTAAVVASHSYKGGLSGCPLSFVLRSLVAELNIDSDYVAGTEFTLEVPPQYEDMLVGLLPAVNTSWQREESVAGKGCRWVQDGSILLTDVDWSTNKAQNDAASRVMVKDKIHQASIKMKCMEGSAATTSPRTGTIEENGKNSHNITIMVVSKATKITAKNKALNAATQGHHVIRISGNASKTEKVSKVLTWRTIHENTAAPTRGTVVQVELDSIYHGRYKEMKDIYRSM